MTVGIKKFRGARLKEARLARGLFKNALGNSVGVTGAAIGRYEEGIDNPQQHRVDAIAEALNIPVKFFTTPEWPENIDVIHWRSRKSESRSSIEMTEQRIKWICELFSFLSEDLDFPWTNIPVFDLPTDFRSIFPEHIERAAIRVRQAWGLALSPIPDVLLALENAGIPVTSLRIPSDKQDGFCFHSNILNKSFIGINIEGASSARARFDAAHELGHLVLHKNVSAEQIKNQENHKILEDQANYFAGAFLFPKDSFVDEVKSVSLDYLKILKRRWGFSISAMIMRARNLNLIDDYKRQSLFIEMGYRKWKGSFGEPFDSPHEMPLEQPRMLRRGIQVLLDNRIHTKNSILNNLPHSPSDIEEIASLNKGFFDTEENLDINIRLRKSIHVKDLESGNVVEFRKSIDNP